MADFQKKSLEFQRHGARLIALSVDGETDTRDLRGKLGLTFEIAYGAQAREFSRRTGTLYEPDKQFLQPAGFVLRRDGTVEGAVYSTGSVGRYSPRDVLHLVESADDKDSNSDSDGEALTTGGLLDMRSERSDLLLVHVLDEGRFRAEQIPQSFHAAAADVGFVDRVRDLAADSSTPIVVYGDGREEDATKRAQQTLLDAGFSCVYRYAGGVRAWRSAGLMVEGVPGAARDA